MDQQERRFAVRRGRPKGNVVKGETEELPKGHRAGDLGHWVLRMGHHCDVIGVFLTYS